MDGSTRQQDSERAALNGQHKHQPQTLKEWFLKGWFLKGYLLCKDNARQSLKEWFLVGWMLSVTPIVNRLHAWQRRVSLNTRNGVLLSGLGLVFLYALYCLIVPFL